MASAMLYRMKEDGCEVQTIHADNDSTTAARLRNDFPSLQKKQDKNHLKKNLTKQLYKLAKDHKQLKPTGTISYVTRCFMYGMQSPQNIILKKSWHQNWRWLSLTCLETTVFVQRLHGVHIRKIQRHSGTFKISYH